MTAHTTMYGKGFFDLQLEFAETVAALSGFSLSRAVLEYTNFYVRFGLGRDFDPAHPEWTAYLAGLRDARDRHDWTYRFYRARPETAGPPGVVATFGCFSYARLGGDRIRLHFHGAERDDVSPLSVERRERRRADLGALFAHVRDTVRAPVRVIGRSWLYNVAAYRRLFPECYLATARIIRDRFQYMPLWGQFLNRRGEIRETAARQFRDRLSRQSSLQGLGDCFPFPVLSLEAPVHGFYDFYGV